MNETGHQRKPPACRSPTLTPERLLLSMWCARPNRLQDLARSEAPCLVGSLGPRSATDAVVLRRPSWVLGGGLAGNTVEHAVHKATSYNVQVRMSDGRYRNFSYQGEPGFQVGQRVRISGDRLSAS